MLWRQNNPEVNYTPLGSPGGVFPGEASRSIQRGMKIGTWNVRSLHRAGPLKAAARELVRYKYGSPGGGMWVYGLNWAGPG